MRRAPVVVAEAAVRPAAMARHRTMRPAEPAGEPPAAVARAARVARLAAAAEWVGQPSCAPAVWAADALPQRALPEAPSPLRCSQPQRPDCLSPVPAEPPEQRPECLRETPHGAPRAIFSWYPEASKPDPYSRSQPAPGSGRARAKRKDCAEWPSDYPLATFDSASNASIRARMAAGVSASPLIMSAQRRSP